MRLVFFLILLVFVGANALHVPARSLHKRTIQHFKEINDMLDGVNFRKMRDSQPDTASKLQGTIRQLADKTRSLMEKVSLKRRAMKENMMSKRDAMKEGFGVLAFKARELQDGLSMKKDELFTQLGLNAKKIAKDMNNVLKRGLTLRREQQIKKRYESKDNYVRLSSDFDWFPWKQMMQEKSERDAKQRDQTNIVHSALSSDFAWFPWKQRSIQDTEKDVKLERAVKQALPDVNVIRDVLRNFDWDFNNATYVK